MRFFVISIAVAAMSLCCSCDRLSNIFSTPDSASTNQVGGYSESRRLTDREKELFDEYVARIGDVEYEALIVAGTNYRFLCKAREIKADGKRGKKFYAVVVLYRPLPGQGEPRVTSIERQKR